MGVVDQLDAAFRLYRQHFATFLGVVALVQAPFLILALIYNTLFTFPLQESMFRGLRSPGTVDYGSLRTSNTQTLVSSLVLLVLGALANTVIIGALSYAVSRAYLNQPVDILGAYREAGPHVLTLLLCGFIVNIPFIVLEVGSFAVSAVPGIACAMCIVWPALLALYVYISLRLLVVPQVVVLENRGTREALRRTWDLLKDHLLRALGLAILVGLVTSILPVILQYVAVFALFFMPVTATLVLAVESAAVGAFQIVVLPILWGAYTLFYYDLRIRKEGLDLSVQAAQMAAGTPPA